MREMRKAAVGEGWLREGGTGGGRKVEARWSEVAVEGLPGQSHGWASAQSGAAEKSKQRLNNGANAGREVEV